MVCARYNRTAGETRLVASQPASQPLVPGVQRPAVCVSVSPRPMLLHYPLQLPPLSLDTLHYSLAPPRSPYISSRPHGPVLSPPSDPIEDVLVPGDTVGEGCSLQGEPIRLLSISSHRVTNHSPQPSDPAPQLEVIGRLGSGSYAVVYLVKEVLARPSPSDDAHISIGPFDLDAHPPQTVYGRKYAIKCLSKANLDDEALNAQLTEVRFLSLSLSLSVSPALMHCISQVTIHQSLHPHPNIVTLHRTLETSSYLLLLLEFVPGEDLFYFLEQARDHDELDSTSPDPLSVSRTPPTPSLLSNLHPSQLLSRTRLRLIASMFSQMCDAVASCHAQHVFHRDIKPENFIVTDAVTPLSNGRQERKVIVKLTDFGLSTTDVESSDMDCGSAPYMSYGLF